MSFLRRQPTYARILRSDLSYFYEAGQEDANKGKNSVRARFERQRSASPPKEEKDAGSSKDEEKHDKSRSGYKGY